MIWLFMTITVFFTFYLYLECPENFKLKMTFISIHQQCNFSHRIDMINVGHAIFSSYPHHQIPMFSCVYLINVHSLQNPNEASQQKCTFRVMSFNVLAQGKLILLSS